MLKKNELITIEQVENGFLVRGKCLEFCLLDNPYVFQTMDELLFFITLHFDHRSRVILVDNINDRYGDAKPIS